MAIGSVEKLNNRVPYAISQDCTSLTSKTAHVLSWGESTRVFVGVALCEWDELRTAILGNHVPNTITTITIHTHTPVLAANHKLADLLRYLQ